VVRYKLASLALLLLPSVAQADRLRVTSYDMDGSGGTVRLESDAPVGEPWLRIDGKTIKIWFPHIQDVSRFDHERESSEPIRALALRGGGSETAMLRVELGNGQSIVREDIAVARDGLQAVVKLRIPSAQPVAVSAPAPVPAPQPSAAPTAAPAAVTTPPPAAAAAVPAAAAPGPRTATTTTTTSPATAAPSNDLSGIGAASDNAETDDGLGTLEEKGEQSRGTLWLLGAASVLLTFVYFGVQHLQRTKKLIRPPSSIEIVGSRRLGHRQELLIVRALGADHLLLCTNGKAERVASSPSGGVLALPADTTATSLATDKPAAASTPNEPEPGAEPVTQAGGIISRLSSQHRLRKLLDSVDAENLEAEDEEQNRGFNDELLTATQKRRALLHSLPAPAARQSEAVSGITRLRQRKSS
jgi:flagellar biogenesis protein FliO